MEEPTEGMERDRSERLLAEAARVRASHEIVDVEERQVKLVVFTLGEGLFAFPGAGIKEILLPPEVTYVPGSPEFIAGVINVRGDIESVLGMASILGLPEVRPSVRNRVLMAETSRMRSGLLVETLIDVTDIPEGSIKEPLSTTGKPLAEFVTGETEVGGRVVTVLGLERIFERVLRG
jgi:purine-binding chemotaxis protein CheW